MNSNLDYLKEISSKEKLKSVSCFFQEGRSREQVAISVRKCLDECYCQENIQLENLAERLRVSKYYLSHCFTACYDIPPMQYLRQKRIEEAKRLLFISSWSVSEIADYVGYENVSVFIRIFRMHKGISHCRYRKTYRDSRRYVNKNLEVPFIHTEISEELSKILDYVDTHFCEEINTSTIASVLNMSRHTLMRIFRDSLNISPSKYLRQKRLEKAKELILGTDESFQVISENTGFLSYSQFYKTFYNHYGFSPRKYRETGALNR